MGEWSGPSAFIFDGPVPPDLLIGRTSELAQQAEQQDRTAVVVADLFDVASMADLAWWIRQQFPTRSQL